MSMTFGFQRYVLGFALENSYNFWFLRSFLVLCAYVAALSIVWYSKVILQKTFAHLPSRPFMRGNHGEAAVDINDNKNEDRMPTRITYHVVPDPSGWLVKKGRAKKSDARSVTLNIEI